MNKNDGIKKEVKKKSIVTKEEWKDFTKCVWSIANTKHEVHPAMFPPEIPLRLIKLFSFYSETVLDPFCGIGTTGKVALELGRKFIGIDTNKQYLSIVKKNFKIFPQDKFQLINTSSKDMYQ